MTRHEKIGLMCTEYTPSHFIYLIFCVSSTYIVFHWSINCIQFSIVCYTSWKSFIDKVCFGTTSWDFKVQNCGQILCAYTHYFLMLGHTCSEHIINYRKHQKFIKHSNNIHSKLYNVRSMDFTNITFPWYIHHWDDLRTCFLVSNLGNP